MAWGVGGMERKRCRGVLNCVAYPGGSRCCECRELVLQVFVCGECSKTVCLACIPRHSAVEPPAKESDHVA